MAITPGTPLDRIHRGIFCGPVGTSTLGYFCFLGDVVDERVSGGTNRGSTKSLPFDSPWRRYEDNIKKLKEQEDLDENERRLRIEDEEIILIFKMFLKCQ